MEFAEWLGYAATVTFIAVRWNIPCEVPLALNDLLCRP